MSPQDPGNAPTLHHYFQLFGTIIAFEIVRSPQPMCKTDTLSFHAMPQSHPKVQSWRHPVPHPSDVYYPDWCRSGSVLADYVRSLHLRSMTHIHIRSTGQKLGLLLLLLGKKESLSPLLLCSMQTPPQSRHVNASQLWPRPTSLWMTLSCSPALPLCKKLCLTVIDVGRTQCAGGQLSLTGDTFPLCLQSCSIWDEGAGLTERC